MNKCGKFVPVLKGLIGRERIQIGWGCVTFGYLYFVLSFIQYWRVKKALMHHQVRQAVFSMKYSKGELDLASHK